jgi:hypothetical protein
MKTEIDGTRSEPRFAAGEEQLRAKRFALLKSLNTAASKQEQHAESAFDRELDRLYPETKSSE